MRYVFLSLLLIGCGSTYTQKPATTENCYDYDSCQRNCKIFKDEHACKTKKLFYKK